MQTPMTGGKMAKETRLLNRRRLGGDVLRWLGGLGLRVEAPIDLGFSV